MGFTELLFSINWQSSERGFRRYQISLGALAQSSKSAGSARAQQNPEADLAGPFPHWNTGLQPCSLTMRQSPGLLQFCYLLSNVSIQSPVFHFFVFPVKPYHRRLQKKPTTVSIQRVCVEFSSLFWLRHGGKVWRCCRYFIHHAQLRLSRSWACRVTAGCSSLTGGSHLCLNPFCHHPETQTEVSSA